MCCGNDFHFQPRSYSLPFMFLVYDEVFEDDPFINSIGWMKYEIW